MTTDQPSLPLIPAEDKQEPPSQALSDLRALAMSAPIETMQIGLAEFKERRDAFRSWLLEQLIEGVHYGFPPGCQPKDDVPKEQWTFKPSLYQAGAEFIIDLMAVRAEFGNDMALWEQLGKLPGLCCRKCRLLSRGTNELLGEGTGSSKPTKIRDHNAVIKMAEKSAKVSAVKNTYGLSDLFTQDLETLPPPEHENPNQSPQASKEQPRDNRVTVTELEALFREWQTCHRGEGPEFRKWAAKVMQVGDDFDLGKRSNWTSYDLQTCYERLAIEREG